jgi:hypothetical protein
MAPSPGFVLRAVAVETGVDRIYNEDEWRDALVVVVRGELELESVGGDSYRFGCGSVLPLAGLRLRVLRSCGAEPVLLFTVSRSRAAR